MANSSTPTDAGTTTPHSWSGTIVQPNLNEPEIEIEIEIEPEIERRDQLEPEIGVRQQPEIEQEPDVQSGELETQPAPEPETQPEDKTEPEPHPNPTANTSASGRRSQTRASARPRSDARSDTRSDARSKTRPKPGPTPNWRLLGIVAACVVVSSAGDRGDPLNSGPATLPETEVLLTRVNDEGNRQPSWSTLTGDFRVVVDDPW